jgi:hypothetical protein
MRARSWFTVSDSVKGLFGGVVEMINNISMKGLIIVDDLFSSTIESMTCFICGFQ